MKLNIGENIRRLRRERDITQERLAQILNVSCAAVSKWETGDSLPDITLLLPLAHFFGISLDRLMGYDEVKMEEEINQLINDYSDLRIHRKFDQATALIKEARKAYPHDYRIMLRYMWDIAGGLADNDPAVLNAHNPELMQICDTILEGCTQEPMRLEALNIKAKLLHAAGQTREALLLLEDFPSFYLASGQKIEQLFAKDTEDYYRQLQTNLYELLSFAGNKAARTIWFHKDLSVEEKMQAAQAIGKTLADLSRDGTLFGAMIFEFSFWAVMAGKQLFWGGNTADFIKCREKNLFAAAAAYAFAQKDAVAHAFLKTRYNTDNFLQWTLTVTDEDLSDEMRMSPEYCAMTAPYRKLSAS